MASTANLAALQHQIRQELANFVLRIWEEMHATINGKTDAINSISSALQRISAGLAETAKPYKISDLIPKSWDGNNERGQFRNFMAELHLRMQAWSNQGERILTRVESGDKVDSSTLAVGCTAEEFRAFETALYQVLHRTTTNELLKMIQQVQGQKGFEAWHTTVRRYGQRNTSDRSSAVCSTDQLGKIRDEEKTLAVKKLMPEGLLNYRVRGITLSDEELLVALENIIIDKVTTFSACRRKKTYTKLPNRDRHDGREQR